MKLIIRKRIIPISRSTPNFFESRNKEVEDIFSIKIQSVKHVGIRYYRISECLSD